MPRHEKTENDDLILTSSDLYRLQKSKLTELVFRNEQAKELAHNIEQLTVLERRAERNNRVYTELGPEDKELLSQLESSILDVKHAIHRQLLRDYQDDKGLMLILTPRDVSALRATNTDHPGSAFKDWDAANIAHALDVLARYEREADGYRTRNDDSLSEGERVAMLKHAETWIDDTREHLHQLLLQRPDDGN